VSQYHHAAPLPAEGHLLGGGGLIVSVCLSVCLCLQDERWMEHARMCSIFMR